MDRREVQDPYHDNDFNRLSIEPKRNVTMQVWLPRQLNSVDLRPVQVLYHDIDFSTHGMHPCLAVTIQVWLTESNQQLMHNHLEILTLELEPNRQNVWNENVNWFDDLEVIEHIEQRKDELSWGMILNSGQEWLNDFDKFLIV